jgi:cyclic pyranopterin phosphate synthase
VTKLSHVGEDGRATMVDVTGKAPTDRTATAAGWLRCQAETLARVRAGTTPKGAVIQTAELAGTMAAKRTADLIPLCHPLPLTKVAVTIAPDDDLPGFRIAAEVRTHGPTGVEMEALTAVSIAALTLYDMVKAVDKTMTITDVELVSKRGGQSGDYERAPVGRPARRGSR